MTHLVATRRLELPGLLVALSLMGACLSLSLGWAWAESLPQGQIQTSTQVEGTTGSSPS